MIEDSRVKGNRKENVFKRRKYIDTPCHCVKNVQIRSFSDPYFPAFGLNTEIYSVRMRENTDQKKIRFCTFHAVCKSKIKTVVGEHVSSENIHPDIAVDGEVYLKHQPFLNKLSNKKKLFMKCWYHRKYLSWTTQ